MTMRAFQGRCNVCGHDHGDPFKKLKEFAEQMNAKQEPPLAMPRDRWPLYELSEAPKEGCKPMRELTEVDVRRIVREELKRMAEAATGKD